MKKPIFDFIDRQIILDYNKKKIEGAIWNKPLIVSHFEITKSKKAFQNKIEKIVFPCLDFLARIFK